MALLKQGRGFEVETLALYQLLEEGIGFDAPALQRVSGLLPQMREVIQLGKDDEVVECVLAILEKMSKSGKSARRTAHPTSTEWSFAGGTIDSASVVDLLQHLGSVK